MDTRSQLKLMPMIHVVVAVLILPGAMAATNVLFTGGALNYGMSLTNGQYALTMQQDCNLVLTSNGNPIQATGTSNMGGYCYAAVETTGELVVYDGWSKRALWKSMATSSQGEYVLILQNDGRLVIYGPSQWTTASNVAMSQLLTDSGRGVSLQDGATAVDVGAAVSTYLTSGAAAPIGTVIGNDFFKMSLLDDCNLVSINMTTGGKIMWETGTRDAMHNCYVWLEATGELTIKYMGGVQTLWTNGVASPQSGAYAAVMKINGVVAVYGPSIWKSSVNGALEFDGKKLNTAW